jgi:uncharacterized cupin superfamily protein
VFLLGIGMGKIDVSRLAVRKGSGYPAPFHEAARDRTTKALGDAASLSDFGVNLVTLPPGNWSSQRHWHSHEDEFVYVLSGELTLVTDAGECLVKAGECAAFPKDTPDGHHFINRSSAGAVYLEVGTRCDGNDICTYPDIDLALTPGRGFTHKDFTPYPPRQGG